MQVFGKKKEKDKQEEKLIEDIRELCLMMENAYERFENESDSDLIDALIYEIESLKARYRYLLRIAKESKITSDAIFTKKTVRGMVNDLG